MYTDFGFCHVARFGGVMFISLQAFYHALDVIVYFGQNREEKKHRLTTLNIRFSSRYTFPVVLLLLCIFVRRISCLVFFLFVWFHFGFWMDYWIEKYLFQYIILPSFIVLCKYNKCERKERTLHNFSRVRMYAYAFSSNSRILDFNLYWVVYNFLMMRDW